jgi:hypothetical protein
MNTYRPVEDWRVRLPDARLRRRLDRMLVQFTDHYGHTIPQTCSDHADMDAVYDFFANPRVAPLAILHQARAATLELIRPNLRLLVAQDGSEANYSGLTDTDELGHLDGPNSLGLKFHSSLAITPDGVPLGLLTQQIWRRDPAQRGRTKQRRQRAATDKESYRWRDHLAAIDALVPAQVQEVVVIADREGDIYDYLAAPRSARCHLLVRLAQAHRQVVVADGPAEQPEKLLDVLPRQPWLGSHTITVPRGDDRPSRQAVLHLRVAAVKVLPPRHAPKRSHLQPVAVWVVEAVELSPPSGEKPVCWRLVSTKPVTTLGEAIQTVRDYVRRWLVERFHYVLKSGCRVEELQLGTADRLANALAFYSQVACRVLRLAHLSRAEPQRRAEVEFDADELATLRAYAAERKMKERAVRTLQEAVRVVAKLGGFVGRARDGEPGVKVLWRGLVSLREKVAGFRLGVAAATARFLDHHLPPQQDTT